MSLKHDTKKTGYATEEFYFEKLNRELIEKMKAKGESSGQAPAQDGNTDNVIPFRPKSAQGAGADTKKKAA